MMYLQNSKSTAESTISGDISTVDWEKKGIDNEAYALVKKIVMDVDDEHGEYTGQQQVIPTSGPNQGKTRWVWEDIKLRLQIATRRRSVRLKWPFMPSRLQRREEAEPDRSHGIVMTYTIY